MLDRPIVPVGYPKWINDVNDATDRLRLKADFYDIMAALVYESKRRISTNTYLITVALGHTRVHDKIADKILSEWMSHPSGGEVPIQGIPMFDIVDMEGRLNHFFEWIVPVKLINDSITRVIFRGKICSDIRSENILLLYKSIDSKKLYADAHPPEWKALPPLEESSYPQTKLVDVVYRRYSDSAKHTYRFDGDHLIPGVTSTENGMLMDVEARKLKANDVFFITDDDNGFAGNAVVVEVNEVSLRKAAA